MCKLLFLKVVGFLMQLVFSDFFRWPLSLRGQPLQHYQPGQLDFELLLRYLLECTHQVIGKFDNQSCACFLSDCINQV